MTVKKRVTAAAEVSDPALHRCLAKALWNDGGDSTTDTESGASSSTEEVESPRSVARWRTRPTKKEAHVHSQVLRVREEDQHLGEDIITIGSGNGFGFLSLSNVQVLPCSRLSHRKDGRWVVDGKAC